MKPLRTAISLVALAAVMAELSANALDMPYSVMPIESIRLPYVGATVATDISDAGWITGTIYPSSGSPYGGYQTTFAYHPSVGFLDLGNIPGHRTVGMGINNSGEITGWAAMSDQQTSFRYAPGIGFSPIGGPGCNEMIGGYNINSSAVIVGTMLDAEGGAQAYRYSPASGVQFLGTLGGANSYGYNINDAGWVVGTSQRDDGSWHAFLYRDGLGMTDLGPGYAAGINNLGVAAGVSAGLPVVFRDGTTIALGNPGGLVSVGDINDHGFVIGVYFDQQGGSHSFLGSEIDGLTDLQGLLPPDSGWVLNVASGINNHNQIVGDGYYNGATWAFRLDPVPEPSTWAFLALGGGLLWLWRRGRGEVPK